MKRRDFLKDAVLASSALAFPPQLARSLVRPSRVSRSFAQQQAMEQVNDRARDAHVALAQRRERHAHRAVRSERGRDRNRVRMHLVARDTVEDVMVADSNRRLRSEVLRRDEVLAISWERGGRLVRDRYVTAGISDKRLRLEIESRGTDQR